MQLSSQVELLSTPNYERIKQNFTQELTNAKEGKNSSLSFIKHTLPKKPVIISGVIQGIVVGGTNYIVSTEKIQTNGMREILNRKTGVLPILKDAQTFFAFMEEHLDSQAQAIGLNFGFPLEPLSGPQGQLDGTLPYPGKEHAMKGLIGKTIGKEVSKLFKTKFNKDIPIAAANDTVCLTLAGDGDENGSIIAGTGFNMGLKLTEEGEITVINLETASFDKFEQTTILKKIDAQSEQPGTGLFQKTVSGKYLALYFNEKAKELGLSSSPLQTSQELSELSHENHHDPAGDLARAILERSAFLVGTAIAGVYEFLNRPSQLILIGEGSMLWNGWRYQENIEKQLEALGVPRNAVQLKYIKDSSINGAIGLLTK
jgi:hexokinase